MKVEQRLLTKSELAERKQILRDRIAEAEPRKYGGKVELSYSTRLLILNPDADTSVTGLPEDLMEFKRPPELSYGSGAIVILRDHPYVLFQTTAFIGTVSGKSVRSADLSYIVYDEFEKKVEEHRFRSGVEIVSMDRQKGRYHVIKNNSKEQIAVLVTEWRIELPKPLRDL